MFACQFTSATALTSDAWVLWSLQKIKDILLSNTSVFFWHDRLKLRLPVMKTFQSWNKYWSCGTMNNKRAWIFFISMTLNHRGRCTAFSTQFVTNQDGLTEIRRAIIVRLTSTTINKGWFCKWYRVKTANQIQFLTSHLHEKAHRPRTFKRTVNHFT